MTKVKVEIRCKETVHYNQIVEMDKADYEKLKDLSGDDVSEPSEEFNLIRDYIDPRDVFDSNNEFESVEVSLYKPKAGRAKRK